MSAGVRRPLAEARALAEEVVALLKPCCTRIEIAGSIRRGKEDVGDIEAVCIPLVTDQLVAADMFGMAPAVERQNMLDELCAGLILRGIFDYRRNAKGSKSWGSDLKWGLYKDFALDIYSATPETWAVTMAIRTGPTDFSHKLVTAKRFGGLCPSHLEFKGWRVRDRRSGDPLETPEESDVFRVLGLDYIPPETRGLELAGAV